MAQKPMAQASEPHPSKFGGRPSISGPLASESGPERRTEFFHLFHMCPVNPALRLVRVSCDTGDSILKLLCVAPAAFGPLRF